VWPKGFKDEPTLPESVSDQRYKVQAAALLTGMSQGWQWQAGWRRAAPGCSGPPSTGGVYQVP
jgi:hypothetical protein